jgi:outer membrane protein assembly factor BamB
MVLVGSLVPDDRRFSAMKTALAALAVVVGTGPLLSSPLEDAPPPPTVQDVAGAWAGTLTHDGETVDFALEIEPSKDGKVVLKGTVPVLHMAHATFGEVPLEAEGHTVRLGPFTFTLDRAAATLSGTMPEGLVPLYAMPVVLHRVDTIDAPERPEPTAPLVEPVWTFDAGSALWAGPTFANGVVYAGTDDGRVVALDAATGKQRWSFRAEGPVRTRPALGDGVVYVQADDGLLYALAADDGTKRWSVRVVPDAVERLPFNNPKSRYDRFGSDVTVVGERLYLGTHDGKVLALRAADGGTLWSASTGDSVLAAPSVDADRVYAGSFDGKVYALDAGTGAILWVRDTRKPVVSTPAVADGLVVVGNRAYDLYGLDAGTGAVVWTSYVWFSWIESSATIRDEVAYVGSSDAAGVFAYDVRTGRRLWGTDVYGWAWGQPAVTATRVYAGTASTVGYTAGHRGGVVALDRASGRMVWRYAVAKPESGPFGFPGSPAVGDGRVYATSLDGRVCAFAEVPIR